MNAREILQYTVFLFVARNVNKTELGNCKKRILLHPRGLACIHTAGLLSPFHLVSPETIHRPLPAELPRYIYSSSVGRALCLDYRV